VLSCVRYNFYTSFLFWFESLTSQSQAHLRLCYVNVYVLCDCRLPLVQLLLTLCVCIFQTLNPCIMFGRRLSTAYHSLFPRAWASLIRQTRHSRRPKALPTAVSSTTLVAQNHGEQVLSLDIDTCSRDLHYKVKGARSNKTWAFFPTAFRSL
jgi:hypothetical protein